MILRPVNFAAAYRRDLSLNVQYSGNIGKAPAPGFAAGPVKDPVSFFLSFGPFWRLADKVLVRDGSDSLDLLNGDTVDGSVSRPKFTMLGFASLFHRGMGLTLMTDWQGRSRIAGSTPSADLRFPAIQKVSLEASIALENLFPRKKWSERFTAQLGVQNLFNARGRAFDREGRTPFRYQPAFLDPLGRTVSLKLRKLF